MTTTDDPITDIARTKQYYAELQEFIRTCLVEGKDGDYGTIPSVRGKCLFQPGAQKLLHWAGLVHSFPPEQFFRTERWDATPVVLAYTVLCRLHERDELQPGGVGAFRGESYGAANSQEARNKSKSAYEVQNTLIKIAQKRAMVGACILTLGLSQEFTQDGEDTHTAAQHPATTAQTSEPKATQSTTLPMMDRFIKATEQFGKPLQWSAMSTPNRCKWLSCLTRNEGMTPERMTAKQWEDCAYGLEEYMKACLGDTDKQSVKHLQKLFASHPSYSGWQPKNVGEIPADLWYAASLLEKASHEPRGETVETV